MVAFVSQEFADALKYSHRYLSQVTANNGGSISLDINSGSITQDYTAASRRSMDLNVMVPEGYTFDQAQQIFEPFLAAFQAKRGLYFEKTGLSELVNCGWFYATKVEQGEDRNGSPTIDLTCYDRSVRSQKKLKTPFYASPGTLVTAAVPQLLSIVDSALTYRIARMPFALPATVVTEDQDPWGQALDFIATTGSDLYMDRDDVCVTSTRALNADPSFVWHYDENNASDFWNVKRSVTRDDVPNVVIVIGDNSSFPGMKGIAYDSDPTSPTYRWGRRDEIVRVFHSDLITSNDQANEMAKYYLSKLLGPQDIVTFSAVANPSLDVGDTIAITRQSEGLNRTRLIVTNITMPLVGSEMQITGQRSILVEGVQGLRRP